MSRSVLMVTQMAGVEECAAAVERQLGLSVQVASTRRAALAALRRGGFDVVVLEEAMARAIRRVRTCCGSRRGAQCLCR